MWPTWNERRLSRRQFLASRSDPEIPGMIHQTPFRPAYSKNTCDLSDKMSTIEQFGATGKIPCRVLDGARCCTWGSRCFSRMCESCHPWSVAKHWHGHAAPTLFGDQLKSPSSCFSEERIHAMSLSVQHCARRSANLRELGEVRGAHKC